ncbi:hypothetical protein EV421DRAFT_1745108 [Armillaria borealis]|uniref:Uncharacterized protein n=1 Tax=Armillaria borealis TaxID=47425 RepID=A0AA39MD23_9AGAR|nr:hypothetical protein EV421DRAFT_1745108 [Armillaria borealis]
MAKLCTKNIPKKNQPLCGVRRGPHPSEREAARGRRWDSADGMQKMWWVGVDNGSTADSGSDRIVWATIRFAMVHNRCGWVNASIATLLRGIQARNGGHRDDERAHGNHGLEKEKQPDIRNPPLKEWEMHEFGVRRCTLGLSIDELNGVLVIVVMGRRCPDVVPTLPLALSSPSQALQRPLLYPRALPHVLPWPLALMAADMESQGIFEVVKPCETRAGRRLSSMLMRGGLVGSEWRPEAYSLDWQASSSSSMEVGVSSDLWGYASYCLVGGLARGDWGWNERYPSSWGCRQQKSIQTT